MRLRCLDSAEDLCQHAAAWDDLWQRSEVALPTTRAEAVTAWLRHFARGAKFQALIVEESGHFVAALPLYGRRLKRLVEVADLPNNDWSASGDLLLDPSCDVPAVLDQLLAAAVKTRWPLLWFDSVPWKAPRWQAWQAAVERAGLSVDTHPRYSVGLIDTAGDWEEYSSELDGDFRRNVRRRMRRLEKLGDLQLQCFTQVDQIDEAVRRVFEVEHRSWKGGEGTSVLSTPGMLEFFIAQARQLAGWGQLAIYSLELDGNPIAFEFGYQAGGAFFAHKVGYDEAYAKEGPGHVLRWLQLPELFAREDCQTFDYFGKLTDAMQRWITRDYELARVVVAPRRPLSRALMTAYTTLWPQIRRFRDGCSVEEPLMNADRR